MDTIAKITERYYGIDFLKMLSMFMVVVLHILGQGGVLKAVSFGSAQFYIAWFLEIASLCAVNAFALATGFLMVGRKVKYRKIFELWLIVQFYNIIFFVIDVIILKSDITFDKILTFVPVFFSQFWYFTAYFCLFFFIPFINMLIDNISKKSHYTLIITGFLLFSLSVIIFKKDPFSIKNGYSTWWLIYLYFVGAAIKKYNLFSKISKNKCLIGYFITVCITYIIKCLTKMADLYDLGFIGKGVSFFGLCFDEYSSSFVLASAVFLLLFCLKFKIPNTLTIAFSKIQPFIFQVYIIHLHYLIWDGFIKDKFSGYALQPCVLLVVYVIGTALGVFLTCVLIDIIRSLLFKLLRINKILNILSDKICEIYSNSKLRKNLTVWFNDRIGI